MGLAPWPVPSPAPACPASWRGSSLEAEAGLGVPPVRMPPGLAVRPPSPETPLAPPGWTCPQCSGGELTSCRGGCGGQAQVDTGQGRRDVASELPTQAPEQAAEEACGGVPPPCQVPPEGSECVCPRDHNNHTQLPAVPPFTPWLCPLLCLQFSFPAPGSPSCRGSPALHPACACCSLAPRQAGHVVPAASLWALSGEASGRAGRSSGSPGWLPWQHAWLLV